MLTYPSPIEIEALEPPLYLLNNGLGLGLVGSGLKLGFHLPPGRAWAQEGPKHSTVLEISECLKA